ncbi:MAG TPA: hypothetical protein VKE24_13135 [Candidatus Acidoferrales bacterium]|nr:hypothetical protein [Candidatus Acidoferrales bacterium]
MQTHDSVDAMVTSYAEQAIKQARDSNVQLDFNENSVMEVETILAQLARQMADAKQSPEDVGEACKVWGSYLGEVVRRRFGGEWSIETYPGKQFATLTLSVGGSKLFPTMKVHRRLTQGEEDNVWLFYKMVKTRLEAAPGVSVQRPN